MTKKRYLAIISLFIFSSSFSQAIVGKHISGLSKVTFTDSMISLLTTPADFEDAKIIMIDSIFYDIVLFETGVIKHISTNDKGFRTMEGIKTEDTFLDIKKKMKVSKILVRELPGWGKYVRLKSEWNAVFDFDAPVSDKSKIVFFFQRIRQ